MQFRERRRVIQVIRTTYDPELKRGRSEVVGKIDKGAPVVTDKLQKGCSAEELAEIATYLANRQTSLRDEAVRAGAETLPAQMRAAAEYFRTHRDDEAKDFALEIRAAWDELKGALRKAGFSKSKVLKQRGEKERSSEAEASPPSPGDEPVLEISVVEVKAEVKADVKAEVPAKAAAAKPAPATKAAPVKRRSAAAKKVAAATGSAAAPVALAVNAETPVLEDKTPKGDGGL